MNTSHIIILAIVICSTVLTVEAIKKYVNVGRTNANNNKKTKKVSIDYALIIASIISNKVSSNRDLKDIYFDVSKNSMSYNDFLKSLNAQFMLSSYYKSETSIQKFKSLVSTVISEEDYKEHFENISADDKLSIEAIVESAEKKGIDTVIKPELDKLAISLKKNQERINEESIRNKISIYISIGSLVITVVSLLYTVFFSH